MRRTQSAIFIDTNIPIYAGGQTHPLKEASARVLDLIPISPGSFVTDAEVLQELSHRYMSIRRWDVGATIFRSFAELMRGHTVPILGEDVESAANDANNRLGLSARDLLHLAVMRRLGVTRIVSADRAFDRVPDAERLDPARISTWRDTVLEK